MKSKILSKSARPTIILILGYLLLLLLFPAYTQAQTPYQVLLNPEADLYIRGSSYDHNNYGNSSIIEIKYDKNSSKATRYGYMKFDLSSIVTGVVTSAILKVKARIVNAPINMSVYGVANDDWQETTTTWMTTPGSGTLLTSQTIAVDSVYPETYYEIDITTFINEQLAGDKVASLGFRSPNSLDVIAMASKESALETDRPFLELTMETAVLPVTMLNYTAQLQYNGQVQLRWTTANEINNDYFLLEKSSNNREFQFLDRVEAGANGNGQQQYEFFDKSPGAGTHLYRLTQVDKDGKASGQMIRSVKNGQLTQPSLSAYPNPFTGTQLNIAVSNLTAKKLIVELLDLQGRKIHSGAYFASAGIIKLQLTQKPLPGTYVLKVKGFEPLKIFVP